VPDAVGEQAGGSEQVERLEAEAAAVQPSCADERLREEQGAGTCPPGDVDEQSGHWPTVA
jgi:hypothetical protein